MSDDSAPSPFKRLLDALGVFLPNGLSVHECVEYGWIVPRLTIKLPETFLADWTSYPSLPSEPVRKGNEWATHVWSLISSMAHPSPARSFESWSPGWHRHFLDQEEYWVTKSAAHWLVQDVALNLELPTVLHPHRPGRPVKCFVHFFAHWQAYQLAEMISAARLVGALWDTPSASADLARTLEELDSYRELSRLRQRRVTKRWNALEQTFDWISRVRTAVGICAERALASPGSLSKQLQKASDLVRADVGLTQAEIREGIRDGLLVLWRDYSHNAADEDGVSPLRAMLRKDIERAVEFLSRISKRPVTLDDKYWGIPDDRQSRRWTPLPRALPYEIERARRDFARQAEIYVRDFNSSVGVRTAISMDEMRNRVDQEWGSSVALRRFVLSFARLHQHYAGRLGQEELVALDAATPVEFLLMCALHCERLIAEAWAGGKLPAFATMLRASAEKALERVDWRNAKAGAEKVHKRIKAIGQLHDLPATLRDPFDKPGELKLASQSQSRLGTCYVNFAVLRNYAAHHDCLDGDLVGTAMAEAPMEALVVAAMGALRQRRP